MDGHLRGNNPVCGRRRGLVVPSRVANSLAGATAAPADAQVRVWVRVWVCVQVLLRICLRVCVQVRVQVRVRVRARVSAHVRARTLACAMRPRGSVPTEAHIVKYALILSFPWEGSVCSLKNLCREGPREIRTWAQEVPAQARGSRQRDPSSRFQICFKEVL